MEGVIIQGGEVEVVGRGRKGDGLVISGIVVKQEQRLDQWVPLAGAREVLPGFDLGAGVGTDEGGQQADECFRVADEVVVVLSEGEHS